MPKIKNKIFVVALVLDGQKVYLESEERGLIDPKTKVTIREARGYFSPDVKDAMKFLEKFNAEFVASAYKGAGVECIKSGERLK